MSTHFKIIYGRKGGPVYLIDGREVSQRQWRKHCRGLTSFEDVESLATVPTGYPYASRALGCLPRQIPEMVEAYKRRGIHVEYDRKGRMIINSKKKRNQAARANNLHDWNGGFNDP